MRGDAHLIATRTRAPSFTSPKSQKYNRRRMYFYLTALLLLVYGVSGQENAIKNLSPSLIECYNGNQYAKWNLLPHNMQTLIDIIRKIEDSPALNMDLRTLSSTLLHRFRQDGIVKNPRVKAQEGIVPYAPLGKQFFRHAQTLRVIPGSAFTFPNDSISALERCTLHSMLSSSTEIFERGDENRVCKAANYAFHRYGRSVGVKEDVETLTPEQIEMITKGDTVDPNSMYPALPPNHPSSALLMDQQTPRSRCPIENGVVKTPWGSVSGGLVLAGIAASLEPQQIRIGDLIRQQLEPRVFSYASEASLDNKFLSTLAGDLAELVLRQSPTDRYTMGADGNWNSSSQPLYYFLSSNERLHITAAEIRGNLDGLVLASQVPGYYGKIGGLKLSQVLDMYYSERGFFDRKYRACNRRTHLLTVAPSETLKSQTHSATVVLSSGLATATFSSEAIEKFAKQAVDELIAYVPTMKDESSCEFRENQADDINEPAVDLTIVVDTTWPFDSMKSILSQLLSNLHINKFNSNFTLINGQDGSLMINSSYRLFDFYSYNSSEYERLTSKGFNLARSLEVLSTMQTRKLNEEQRIGWGGGKSDVTLFMPYQSSISEPDKTLVNTTLNRMREEVPDAVILFLAYSNKDGWSELVVDSKDDVVTVTTSEMSDSYPAVDTMVNRIKRVPRRLINSQCGAYYEAKSNGPRQVTDYVGPNGVNFYRIHPNYFMSDNTDNPPRIKIQGMGASSLKVCASRDLLHVNASAAISASECETITSNSRSFSMNCEGVSTLHECKPYYFSVRSVSNNTGNFGCTDMKVCRFPDNIKYTISFENMVCKSGAGTLVVTPLILLALIARLF